jgi:hypothetical protein
VAAREGRIEGARDLVRAQFGTWWVISLFLNCYWVATLLCGNQMIWSLPCCVCRWRDPWLFRPPGRQGTPSLLSRPGNWLSYCPGASLRLRYDVWSLVYSGIKVLRGSCFCTSRW